MKQLALIGNPNTGKTSLFNHLTGSYEYVGNWSGVTVEKKVGTLKQSTDQLIDLPGVYSLSPLSEDEAVVSRFLLNESFSAWINIVDASQIERNLQLTLQLLEFEKPLIIGLNMMDVAQQRGVRIDIEQLSEQLGVAVTPIVARSGKGCERLREAAQSLANSKPFALHYGERAERVIAAIAATINHPSLPARALAIQYVAGNAMVRSVLDEDGRQAERHALLAEDWSLVIFEVRKQYIAELIARCVERKQAPGDTLTAKIDAVVTNRILGIPLFLAFMYLVFKLTFDWFGSPMSDLLDGFIGGTFSEWTETLLVNVGASSFIKALILEGIIAGVGGVLVFVPQIFVLFFFISFLEDSGYMARVALVMDRLLEKLGLNGKAFIPMIIGFGCNVPGVMAARTIEQPRERLLTMLLTPLMSCSARLPVYALFVGAFFVHYRAPIVLSMYVLGVALALLLAFIFSKTMLRGEASVFVIELPPYRVPQWQSLARSTWDKGKGFVRKAGTFIFGGSVVIWLMTYAGPNGLNVQMDDSFLALVGGVFAPLLAPLGFGTWQAGASLLTGFLAKEVVVSTMNIIYHVPDEKALTNVMMTAFTPLAAYSFMAFILLYVPCLATVATIYKESGSRKWTAFSIGYALVLAYVVSLVIYQGGRLFGF